MRTKFIAGNGVSSADPADKQLESDKLAEFSLNGDLQALRRIADDPKTPSWMLAQLAADEPEDIRVRVAKNANTDQDTLRYLLHDPSALVRASIAHHPFVPKPFLMKLLSDDDVNVRVMLANMDTIRLFIYDTLQHDPDEEVRAQLGANSSVPFPVLLGLLEDESSSVVNAVVHNVNGVNVFKFAVQYEEYLPQAICLSMRYSSDYIARVLSYVPLCPGAAVFFAAHADSVVRLAVANNEGVPLIVTEELMLDRDDEVSSSAKSIMRKRGHFRYRPST